MTDAKVPEGNEPKSLIDRVVDGVQGALSTMIAGIFLSAVALIAIPFDITVAATGGIVLALATLAFVGARRAKTKVRQWSWGGLAAMFFLAGVVWGVVGVLVTTAEPRYLFIEPGEGVQTSRIQRLIPAVPDAGTLILVRDPVRSRVLPYVLPRLERLLDLELHTLTTSFVDDARYVEMPLDRAFWGTRQGTSLRGFTRTLQIPTHGVTYTLDLARDGESITADFKIGVTTGILIETLSERGRNGAPWQAIHFPTVRPDDTLQYAALLDAGLSAASTGETEAAFQLLELAHAVAPTRLEETRAVLLLALLADRHLQGNVLHSQALDSFFEAHRIALRHLDGWTKSGDLGSLLGVWIEQEIGGGLLPYKRLFPDDPILQKTTRITLGTRTFQNSQETRTTLEQAETFLQLGSNPLDPFLQEQQRIGSLGDLEFEREASEQRNASDTEQRRFVDMAFRSLLASPAGKLDGRRAQALTALIYSMRPERQETYLLELGLGVSIGRIYAGVLSEDQNTDLATWHLLHYHQQLARHGIGRRMLDAQQAVLAETLRGTPVAKSAGIASAKAWWSGDYLDWFIAQAVRVVWADDSSDFDVTPMLFDSGKSGRVFLPGAYALLTYDSDAKTATYDYIRALFREHVGYSFEEIRACEAEWDKFVNRPATAQELKTPLMEHPAVLDALATVEKERTGLRQQQH